MNTATVRKLEPMPAFQVLDDGNTATVSLNNPYTGDQEMVSTLADVRAIASAVLGFAMRQEIPPQAVEYSVLWPTAKAED